MSYMTVPTIRVMREDGKGSHLINLSDFDADKHILPEDAEKKAAPKKGRKNGVQEENSEAVNPQEGA